MSGDRYAQINTQALNALTLGIALGPNSNSYVFPNTPVTRDQGNNPLSSFAEDLIGVSDFSQPTYGYFGGGGFDFGATESLAHHADPQSYKNYQNANPGKSFTVEYVDYTNADFPVKDVTFQTSNPNAPNYCAPYSSLTATDKLYFAHDFTHATDFDQFKRGKISQQQEISDNLMADQTLVNGLQVLPSSAFADGTPVQQTYQQAFKSYIILELGAAIQLEKGILAFKKLNFISSANLSEIDSILSNSNLFSSINDPNQRSSIEVDVLGFGAAAGTNSLTVVQNTATNITLSAQVDATQSLLLSISQNGEILYRGQTTTSSGTVLESLDTAAQNLSGIQVNTSGDLEFDAASGATTVFSHTTGAATIAYDGHSLSAGAGGEVDLQPTAVIIDPSSSGDGEKYALNATGFQDVGFNFSGYVAPNESGASSEASSLQSAANSEAPPDTPSTAINDSQLNVGVATLSNAAQQSQMVSNPGPLSSNTIFGYGGASISASGQGSSLLPNVWSDVIANGAYRPGYQMLEPDTSDPTAQSLLLNAFIPSSTSGDIVNDTSTDGFSLSYLDPLLLDLTGAGINVSNWINNTVYFDDGVNPSNPAQADGEQHHTSWAQAGTGMVVLDPSGGAITNITQMVSEFLNAGPSPGHYADGLAALAALTTSGATSFSAATSATDPNTNKSYWSEIEVWNDANQNGVTDAGELQTLAALGITSISLQGSGNTGAAINGNSVTNSALYTRSDGSQGQVASVNFQTDALGDVSTTASGGVVIKSLTEGGPTKATTFVAGNTSAHTYTISNGVATDTTTNQVVIASGASALLSSNQNDTVTVAAGDTGTYWLGGGTGADTLTGGGGTNVFLINPSTIVHGGTGANSFNIAKVVGTAAVNVDLAKDNLQEVVGGPGGDILNASGTSWNVFIQAGSGNSIIIGGAGTDALSGGTGDDLIEAGPGGSDIHAGSGNDIIYGGSGSSSQTQPLYVNAGAATNAGYVERLYYAGLRREADAGGFTGYTSDLNNGTYTQTQLASIFIGSSEWQGDYGTQTDSQFVTSMFNAFLGRPPSSSELNSYTTALGQGTTRATVLETLATSAPSENYLGSKHPGASDVIFGGPGQDVVKLGSNNSEVFAGTGSLTVVGYAGAFSVIGLHDSYADYTMTHNGDGTTTLTDDVAGSDGPVTFDANVTDLDFKDISQIPVAEALAMPVNDQLYTNNASQVTINASNQYVISAATLLANDKDYAGKTLSIRELLDNNSNSIARGSSGTVNGGTVALSSDGSTITFTPAAGSAADLMSFRYHVEDSNNQDGLTVQQVGTSNTAELTATVYLNTPSQPVDPLLDSEWFLQAASVLPVWSDYTGAGVSVGVFDPSGNVDFTNPDLAPNAGKSVQTNSQPGVQQVGTHATLVAGVIGAAADGAGAVGVAYNATISSEALGIGQNADVTNTRDWMNYDVVNNSWGNSSAFFDNFISNPAFGQSFYNAVAYGRGGNQSNGQDGLGTVIVFAGGNGRASGDNTNYHNESNSRYAIVVGGINAPSDLGSLQLSGAPFSSPGASILVSAPANNITSTGVTYTNAYGQNFGADYQTAVGTSFATPIVSGVVALMLQANPTLGYRDVQKILAYSSVLVPDATDTTLTYNGADNWNGGGLHTSENYGFGEVDALAAVRLAETWQTQSTVSNEAVDSVVRGQTSTTPTATALNLSIPTGAGVTESFAISGGATGLDVEHADVELDLNGVNPNNLIVTLKSPSGVISHLVNQNTAGVAASGNLDFTFDSVRDYGEVAAGTWTVNIAYASGTTAQGTLAGVALNLYGSQAAAGSPQTFFYTDEFQNLDTGSRATLQDSSGASDTLNAAAATGVVDLDLKAGSTDSTIDGKALAIGSTTHIDYAFLGDGGGQVIGNNDGNTLVAGRGAATLIGGNGDNTFYGGGANSYGTPTTHDILTGGSASDLFYLGTASAAVSGGAGFNTLDFVYAPSAVTVNLVNGTGAGAASGDTFSQIQGVLGSKYNDTVVGWGGLTLNGGGGTDTLDYSSAPSAVTVDFNAGTAQVGNFASDQISNFQDVVGSAYDDYFTDGASLGSVDGGAGDNSLDFTNDPGTVTLNLSTGSGTGGFGNTLNVKNVDYVFGAYYHVNNLTASTSTMELTGSLSGGDTFTATGTNAAVAFVQSSSAVNVNLSTGVNTGGAAQGDKLINVSHLVGSQYNDTLTGNSQNNTFDGYFGNDTISGGGGYDVYYFADEAGYGQDTIINGTTANNNAEGELNLGTAGVYNATSSNVWFQRVGNNLQVDILGTTTSVTLQGWFTNAYNQLHRIIGSDGKFIETSAINQLQQAMASYQTSNPSFNPQASGQTMPSSLDSQIAADWSATVMGTTGNDTFTPGSSNEVLVGDGGNDTYYFPATAGQVDVINGVSGAAAGQIDLRLLGTNNLWFSRSNNDLLVQIIGQTGEMTIQGWFDTTKPWRQVADFLFYSDNSQVTAAQVTALTNAMATYQAANPNFNPQLASAMPTDPTGALTAALNTDWSRTISTTASTVTPGYGNNTIAAAAAGAQTFQFADDGGANVITGFVTGSGSNADHIDLLGLAANSTIDISGSGSDTIISYGANLSSTITLKNIAPSALLLDTNIAGAGTVTYDVTSYFPQQSLSASLGAPEAGGAPYIENLVGNHFAGSQTLSGDTNANVLLGNGYSNTLIGNGGSDTYELYAGGGSNTIYNGTSTNNVAAGTLEFDAAMNPAAIWLSKTGNDLVITQIGTSSTDTIKNWYASGDTYAQLAYLEMWDGSKITNTQINNLEAAMATYQAANPSFSPSTAGASIPIDSSGKLQAALAADWARTLTATGADEQLGPYYGSDTLVGDSGNDEYLFSPGMGQDTIINGAAQTSFSGSASLSEPGNFGPNNVWLDKVNSGQDLKITEMGTSDSVTVQGWFNTSTPGRQLYMIDVPGYDLYVNNVATLVSAMATFESNYSSSHGGAAFNPASTSNPVITDSTVLTAVSHAWTTH